jgi:hypothetical protein
MPVQAFETNTVKKGRVIIEAENFKNGMALGQCFLVQP